MIIANTINEVRQQVLNWRQQGLKVAFVPTMGNLHQGHLTLVKTAKQHADKIVASIFVNPMQFNDANDLANYPKTMDADQQALIHEQTDLLYIPTVEQIYPKGLEQQSAVEVPTITEGLCGGNRPGHFRGVSTVVAKLFNIVQPDVACFGEKDFQQLQVIKTMVEDLSFPIEVIAVATCREQDGLAMSSRNTHLTQGERVIAPELKQCMDLVAANIAEGCNIKDELDKAKMHLTELGFKVDYLEVRREKDLQLVNKIEPGLRLFAAAYLGKPRLIDNIAIKLSK
ncbi:pantoate--beta-alanine ligase [Paraferrimonas sp. SM1919]|uniref:pantoate--beta-alanine ligase n=1 Tax=Paraferrimonas sp. SM1919 TaxID=2662263 RepID=UPI0013D77F03|nr:pantoate--beta-alanine ligase [Paraferrimonas sp. SM1919]